MVAAVAPAAKPVSAAVRRLGTVAVIVAFVAALAACGSDDGDDDSLSDAGSAGEQSTTPTLNLDAPPTKPPCETLSRDEVAALLGNPVKEPEPVGTRDCTWATDVDGGTSVNLTVSTPGSAGADQECRALRNSQAKEDPHEAVSGVGTSGQWVWQKNDIIVQGSLVACWDDAVVMVLLTGEHDQAQLRATATEVAKKVHDGLRVA